MSQSNNGAQKSRTAIILIGAVVLLFLIWLLLKMPWQSDKKKQPGETVQKEETVRRKKKDEKQEKSDAEEKEKETKEKEKEEKETGSVSPVSKKSGERASPDRKTDETGGEQDESKEKTPESKTEERDKKTEDEPDVTPDNSGSDDKPDKPDTVADARTGEDDSVAKKKKTVENRQEQDETKEKEDKKKEKPAFDPEKLNRAKQLFDNQKYERALELLSTVLNKTNSEERKATFRKLKKSWKTEYEQRRKLARKWIQRAEDAAEKNNWSDVEEYGNNILEHLPGSAKAKRYIEKAREMKVYEDMVKIPGGTYSLSEPGNQNASSETRISSFYIDRNEVTNAEYRKFVEDTNREAPLGWGGREVPVGKDDHPVTGIRYSEAKAYASWAGKRLPNELEWEAAARGKEGRAYPWGNSKESEEGSIPANTNGVGLGGTVSVEEFQQGCTPLHVCHMLGNVAEWTTTKVRKTGGVKHVVKGGSYLYQIEKGKPNKRLLRDPGVRLMGVGFRCVKDPR